LNRETVVKNLKIQFPRMRTYETYANLILEGIIMDAINKTNSKKRSDFLKSGNVHNSEFNSSYLKYGILEVVKNIDSHLAIASSRTGLIFSYEYALSILNKERSQLYKNMNNGVFRKNLCNILKIKTSSRFNTIYKRIENGNVMKQVSTYTKIYNSLKKLHISINGCMWMGIVTLPTNRYYLSDLAKSFLNTGSNQRR